MAPRATVDRVEHLFTGLERARKRALPGLTQGLTAAGSFLLDKSREIVPVDTGNLHSSGFVTLENVGTLQAAVVVGYDADQAPYAIYVHEDLHAQHQPGKQAKYLEQPARQYRDAMKAIVYREARKAASRGRA
jgi:hypothetical protein